MSNIFEIERDLSNVRACRNISKAKLESMFISHVTAYLELLKRQETYRRLVDIEIESETDYRNCPYNNIRISVVVDVWSIEQLADKIIEFIMDNKDEYVLSYNYSLYFWAANSEADWYRITPMSELKAKLIALLDDKIHQKTLGDTITYEFAIEPELHVGHEECDF